MIKQIHQLIKDQITSKRQQFYFQIKQRSKLNIMNQIRCQYLKQQNSSGLSQLIAETQDQIDQFQLRKLIGYAQSNLSNAVIHIGNLFIDEIFDERVFQILGFKWLEDMDTDSGYFQWLLLILLNKKYYEPQLTVYKKMMTNIINSNNPNQFRIINSMKCMNYLIVNHKQQFITYIIENSNNSNCLQLLKHCYSKSLQICKQSWRFANNIFNNQQLQISMSVVNMYVMDNFVDLVQSGLVSVHGFIRALACQIFNNNIEVLVNQWNQGNTDIRDRVRELITNCANMISYNKQKLSVKIQISYLLLNYLEKCQLQQIFYHIHEGLAKTIKQGIQIARDQQCKEMEVNFIDICKLISKICFQYRSGLQEEKEFINRIFCQLSSQGILVYCEDCDMDAMG